MPDINGKPWARLSELRIGMYVQADGDFPCIPNEAILRVNGLDDGTLFVNCCGPEDSYHYDEQHSLDGQLDFSEENEDELVGFYLIEQVSYVRK